jgi:hypothetical protein
MTSILVFESSSQATSHVRKNESPAAHDRFLRIDELVGFGFYRITLAGGISGLARLAQPHDLHRSTALKPRLEAKPESNIPGLLSKFFSHVAQNNNKRPRSRIVN